LKIAFWSNSSDQCEVSANVAAISVASVIRFPYSIIVMENKLSTDNLGRAFIGNSHSNHYQEAGTNYYDGSGIEGLIRKIYRSDQHTDILLPFLKEIILNHLYYIPQGRVIHNEIFDYELECCIPSLMELIKRQADICLCNTASQKNLSTRTILEASDLIVVNLCQKQTILEDFFLNNSSMISKALFIISNYESNAELNYRKISKLYNIPYDDILLIPSNQLFNNSFRNGDVVEFISNNYSCKKDNPNYLYIQSIKKAAYLMIKKAELMKKKKELLICGS
jgi:hypothetical protein